MHFLAHSQIANVVVAPTPHRAQDPVGPPCRFDEKPTTSGLGEAAGAFSRGVQREAAEKQARFACASTLPHTIRTSVAICMRMCKTSRRDTLALPDARAGAKRCTAFLMLHAL